MAIDTSVYALISKPYRYDLQPDVTTRTAIQTNYPLARLLERDTRFSTMSDVATVNAGRVALLAGATRRFPIEVQGADYLDWADFEGTVPAAMLYGARWGLSAGRKVIVAKWAADLAADRTRLVVWGCWA